MLYEISVQGHFSSAHMLRGYKGKCEEIHGHNWKVRVCVVSEKLDNIGMVVDFKELKEKLDNVLNQLDHKLLNDITFFKKINPTSENIAKFIYEKLNSKLQTPSPKLQKVTVWETDTSCATYKGE